MKKIGFIGSQSMHTVYFGRILSAGVAGLNSDSGRLWAPDAPELTFSRLAEGDLYNHCDSVEELIDESDAVMVLVRNGEAHRDLAELCIKRGRPIFVDKPFACSEEDAAAILAAAEASGLPVMGGSTLCWLPEIAEVAARLPEAKELHIRFIADWNSPFGGFYYYGSHLTDLCAALAGTEATGFEAWREGEAVEARVFYEGLTVRLTGAPTYTQLEFYTLNKDGSSFELSVADYERCYRLGMERFSQMLRDGESVCPEKLLFSTRLLDGIVKTLSAGQTGRQGL